MVEQARLSKYAIKPEYLKTPSVRLTRNRIILALISAFIGLTRLTFKWDKRIRTQTYRVRGKDGNSIKVIQIKPKNIKTKTGALVYYHGGAFFMTYAAMHLERAQEYALTAGIQVFMVDYRLSYKHAFPAAMDDCYSALQWVHSNANMLGVLSKKIAVGGDSAGGALAASVAQIARDKKEIPLKAQYLIYPVLDSDCKTKSATKFIDTPLFVAEDNRVMWDVYLRESKYNRRNSEAPRYASAAHCKNLKNLPPAYIESAQFDPLSDEARDYAKALENAGVKTHFIETKGTIHAYDFYQNSPTTKKYYKTRLQHFLLYLGNKS